MPTKILLLIPHQYALKLPIKHARWTLNLQNSWPIADLGISTLYVVKVRPYILEPQHTHIPKRALVLRLAWFMSPSHSTMSQLHQMESYSNTLMETYPKQPTLLSWKFHFYLLRHAVSTCLILLHQVCSSLLEKYVMQGVHPTSILKMSTSSFRVIFFS